MAANRIAFETRGSGPAVLVLHGGRLDRHHMIDALEPAFVDAGDWQRVYADLPGHGESDGTGPNTQSDVFERVLRFARTLGPRIAIIGESRGSYHARALAARAPDLVAGLCLIVTDKVGSTDASARPPHEVRVPDPALLDSLPEVLRQMLARQVVQTAEIADKIARLKLPADQRHDAALAERLAGAFQFDFELEAAPHAGPSLIVNGRQDAMAGYAEAMALLPAYPNATFAALDTAGHGLAWERPALFKALVRDWLGRLAFGFWP
ncbi:MAG: alpha/beta fold hydrolase [Rhodobacteraceae bacterium]|nr:alpha/beta fold hydrolase [Paracoccaceae bacterium]